MKLLRALALLIGASALAFGQGILMPMPVLQFSDGNGLPLAGGQIFTCVTGSSCPGAPLAAYTDATLTVPLENPIILNAAGEVTNQIWLGTSPYKIVVEDALGNVLSVIDPVAGPATPATVAAAISAALAGLAGVPGNFDVAGRLISGQSPSIDVTDAAYGAKGDGVTNDGPAIQRAVNYAQTNGGRVFLPCGHYHTLTPGVSITTPIELSGVGYCSNISGTGFTILTVSTSASVLGSVVSDLQISEENAAGNAATVGLSMSAVISEGRNLYLNGSVGRLGSGIVLAGGQDGHWSHVRTYGWNHGFDNSGSVVTTQTIDGQSRLWHNNVGLYVNNGDWIIDSSVVEQNYVYGLDCETTNCYLQAINNDLENGSSIDLETNVGHYQGVGNAYNGGGAQIVGAGPVTQFTNENPVLVNNSTGGACFGTSAVGFASYTGTGTCTMQTPGALIFYNPVGAYSVNKNISVTGLGAGNEAVATYTSAAVNPVTRIVGSGTGGPANCVKSTGSGGHEYCLYSTAAGDGIGAGKFMLTDNGTAVLNVSAGVLGVNSLTVNGGTVGYTGVKNIIGSGTVNCTETFFSGVLTSSTCP